MIVYPIFHLARQFRLWKGDDFLVYSHVNSSRNWNINLTYHIHSMFQTQIQFELEFQIEIIFASVINSNKFIIQSQVWEKFKILTK